MRQTTTLARCQFCGDAFKPQGVRVHEASCRKKNGMRPQSQMAAGNITANITALVEKTWSLMPVEQKLQLLLK